MAGPRLVAAARQRQAARPVAGRCAHARVPGDHLPMGTLIPEDFSYTELTGLTLEAREKLARIRPKNLGQAGRIPGVSPSDVAQLSIALAANRSKA